MASAFSSLLQFEQPDLGGHTDTWGTILNTQYDFLERAIAGRQALTVTVSDVTLTDTTAENQSRYMFLDVTGAITGAMAKNSSA